MCGYYTTFFMFSYNPGHGAPRHRGLLKVVVWFWIIDETYGLIIVLSA